MFLIKAVFILIFVCCCALLKCAVPKSIHTPPTEGIEISWGVGGSVRPKKLKKCMKLNWNFHRGGGGVGLRKNPFLGGGMDILWNYTIYFKYVSNK